MSEPVRADTIVKDLLDHRPEAVKAFLDLDLMCVGCPVAAFHTLADAAREHRRGLADLLRSLNRILNRCPECIVRDSVRDPRVE